MLPPFQLQSARRCTFALFSLALLSPAAEKITFDDHIFPIFESKCLNCHNPDKKKGDLDLSTYTGALTGSSGGKVALTGDGGSSKLYTVTVHTEEPVMPPKGDKIEKKSADLIRDWIDGGLLENKGSKAKKARKPSFTLGAIPTGKRPDGPAPLPQNLLLEPVITPGRATVVADMEASPWAPLLAVTAPQQVLLYHTDTLELVGILPFPKGNPETLSFHPGGKYLLAGGGIGGQSGTTITWDITTGKVIMTMGREFDSVLAADLRADLGGIALGGPSRLVKLWDTQTNEQIKSIKKHTDWITALAYSPDGVLLATGDRNNGVQIWEAATGNEFHSLRGHQKAIVDIKWRADSNLIATASEDDTIRFWDMNQGKEIKKATAGGGGILALDYARSGKAISASRDRRIKLWKPDLTLEKQSQPATDLITEVAFSHDAARFFTADWNGRIEVWNTTDFKKIGELSATPPSITSRLATLAQEKATFQKKLEALRTKATTAKTVHQGVVAQLAQTETSLTSLRASATTLQKEANTFSTQSRQLDNKAKQKLSERDQLVKKTKDPAQQKRQLVDERAKLAAEQNRLGKEHAAAAQALVNATRETVSKREATQQSPDDLTKKSALTAAEKLEHQQRQALQQITTKVDEHRKLLAKHEQVIKAFEAEQALQKERLKKMNTEHQKLITQHDEAKKSEKLRLAELKRKKDQIPVLQKQIPTLRKSILEKQKLAQSAQDEFTKNSAQSSLFDAKIKKWRAAAKRSPQ